MYLNTQIRLLLNVKQRLCYYIIVFWFSASVIDPKSPIFPSGKVFLRVIVPAASSAGGPEFGAERMCSVFSIDPSEMEAALPARRCGGPP